MIALIHNILMYLILKSAFCECLWHDRNYYICVYHLLYILIELLHYLQQSRNPRMASSSSAVPHSDAIKPEVFDGTGFKRWQARTRLWLMELGLFWVLTEELAVVPGDDVPDEVERARLASLRTRWEKANGSALERILAVLSNRLFDVYVSYKEAIKVWTELNDKYAESDNGNKSFLVASYLNFRMGDGRSVVEQIHELQLIARDLAHFECVIPESFQVNSILAKLPTSWRHFVTARCHLKHRLTLNELIAAINVEEKSKAGFGGVKAANVQANVAEHRNQPAKNVKKEKKVPGLQDRRTIYSRRRRTRSSIMFVVKKITRQTGARTIKEGVLRLIVSMELRLKCMCLLHRPTTPVQALLQMGMYQWLLWQIHHLNGGLILVQPDTYVLIDLASFPCRLQQVDPC
jgi:hypothetical protein